MSRFKLFKDKEKTIEHTSNIIYENDIYYIQFTGLSHEAILQFQFDNRLSQFIDYIKGNETSKFQIQNHIGNLSIDGIQYDVRTKKFYKDKPGVEQFNKLLSEIENISNSISFDVTGKTTADRIKDWEDPLPSIFERFSYYKQLILDFPKGANLKSLIESVLANPKFYLSKHSKYSIYGSKVFFNSKEAFNINSRNELIELPEESPLARTRLAKVLKGRTGRNLFPSKFLSGQSIKSYNTIENQFIKFFLDDIINTCSQILSKKKLEEEIKIYARKMISEVMTIKRNRLFQNVGKLTQFPTSSTVLISREGYRDIYNHYIESRFGFKNLLQSMNEQIMHSPLKNINKLYEIWTFYYLVKVFIGNEKVVKSRYFLNEKGGLIYGISMSDSLYTITYNQTFNYDKGLSYSLNFAPDITIQKSEDSNLFLFDAKFKVKNNVLVESDEEFIKAFKSEDIYKMHTYLDAIQHSKFAVIAYPGTSFVFYERDFSGGSSKHNVSEISNFEGVGAVPLLPDNTKKADEFIKAFKASHAK